MSNVFKVEIVNPERSFYSSENVSEAIIPAYDGEMGILKDHISIISFLKPGIIKIIINNSEEKFYVEDGIIEFKENCLSILTSTILDLKNPDQKYISQSLEEAEKRINSKDINDQDNFLINQKIDVLKSIKIN